MADTKEKLLRVLQIMQETDQISPINSTEIIKKLDNRYNLKNIDRKSIYRDLRLMETLGFGVTQCDDTKKGWYMDHHPLEDWEIRFLIDSCYQASCISNSDTEKLVSKLKAIASNRGQHRLNKIVVPRNHNKIKDASSDMKNQIELLLESAQLGLQVKFQYTTIDQKLNRKLRRDGDYYYFSLYSLYLSKNNYYLVGYHEGISGFANFRLDRIENLSLTDIPIVPAEESIGENASRKLQEYFETRVDNYGGQKIKLVLECEPTELNMQILYDFSGSDQDLSVGSTPIITELANGKVRVSIFKQNSPTLKNWIMQYAPNFTVISPEEVREEVKARLKETLALYND